MSVPLTPQIVEAAYEYLRVCPPFDGWELPPGEEVEFTILATRDRYGHYTRYQRTDEHILAISSRYVGHTDTLLAVLAHEMVHLAQAIAKTESKGSASIHNADFWRRAKLVCSIHGWDEKSF